MGSELFLSGFEASRVISSTPDVKALKILVHGRSEVLASGLKADLGLSGVDDWSSGAR